MTSAEIAAELALLKEDRTKVRVAIRSVLENAQTYSLDTSQSKQMVSRANLTELRNLYDWLNEEIERLENELVDATSGTGAGARIIPGF